MREIWVGLKEQNLMTSSVKHHTTVVRFCCLHHLLKGIPSRKKSMFFWQNDKREFDMNSWRSFRHKWYLHPTSRSEDFWSCHSINLLCNHAFFASDSFEALKKITCVCVGAFHRCSVGPAERHCRLVTRDLSDLVGTLIRYSCSFPPLPALSFSVRWGKRWRREAKQRHVCLCHRWAGPLARLSERRGAPFTMAFHIPTLEKVAGERAACRPHGNKTLGRVKKRGCRSTLGPCPHSQVMWGTFCVTLSITHCCFWPHTHPLL